MLVMLQVAVRGWTGQLLPDQTASFLENDYKILCKNNFNNGFGKSHTYKYVDKYKKDSLPKFTTDIFVAVLEYQNWSFINLKTSI